MFPGEDRLAIVVCKQAVATDHTANLHARLCDIANTLRGKMGADEFRDYILGFIFYKYLSEKMHSYADELLKPDGGVHLGPSVWSRWMPGSWHFASHAAPL